MTITYYQNWEMPHLPSDCCEDFFSALRSFVANKRVFTCLEASTDNNMAACGFAAPPIKSKNSSLIKDDMNDEMGPQPGNWGLYLPGDLARGWRVGVLLAYKDATADGMQPKDHTERWWAHPH